MISSRRNQYKGNLTSQQIARSSKEKLRFSQNQTQNFSKNGSKYGNYWKNNQLSKDAQMEYNILFPKKKQEENKSLNISQISRNISRFRDSQSITKNDKGSNNFGEISKKKVKSPKNFYFNKKDMKSYSNRVHQKPKIMNLKYKKAKQMNLIKSNVSNRRRRFNNSSKNPKQFLNVLKNKKKSSQKISNKKLNEMLYSIKSTRNSHYRISQNQEIYNTFTG
jgi:hypothetical protein